MLAEQKEERQFHEYLAALQCAVLVNMNRKKGSKPVKPADFMASLKGGRKKKASWQEMKAKVMQLHRMFGGKFADDSKAPKRPAKTPPVRSGPKSIEERRAGRKVIQSQTPVATIKAPGKGKA